MHVVCLLWELEESIVSFIDENIIIFDVFKYGAFHDSLLSVLH